MLMKIISDEAQKFESSFGEPEQISLVFNSPDCSPVPRRRETE